MEFTKSEAKAWAKKHYHGLVSTLSPSFTPDLKELDEEGISMMSAITSKRAPSAFFASKKSAI